MNPKRNLWPLAIFMAFGIFIAGMATLIVIACSNPSSLVASDYYEQEIQYQTEIDRLARANALPQKPAAGFDNARRAIMLSLPAEHAAARASGKVHLYRPSTANLDQHNALNLDEQGRQVIDANELTPGLWRIKVTWNVSGTDYSMEQDLLVPARNL